MLIGDFNLAVNPEEDFPLSWVNLLTAFGLTQHKTGATHDGGHVLDLLITHSPPDHEYVSDVKLADSVTGHRSIIFRIKVPSVPNTPITLHTSRPLKVINKDDFRRDLQQSLSHSLLQGLPTPHPFDTLSVSSFYTSTEKRVDFLISCVKQTLDHFL
jgi:hypothetical protein